MMFFITWRMNQQHAGKARGWRLSLKCHLRSLLTARFCLARGLLCEQNVYKTTVSVCQRFTECNVIDFQRDTPQPHNLNSSEHMQFSSVTQIWRGITAK